VKVYRRARPPAPVPVSGLGARIGRVADACARDRALFEVLVRALMCTVELEDRLAKRGRVRSRVPLRNVLSGPWDSDPSELEEARSVDSGSYADYLESSPPLLVAFETVLGEVLYAVDRGSARVTVAKERGLGRIPAEVYAPPYRLPSTLAVSLRRGEPGWIIVVGGNPPEVALPVGGREAVEAVSLLLELRGSKVRK